MVPGFLFSCCEAGEDRKEKEVERTSETVYQRLYNSLIESVDAIDNGVNQYKVNGENNQNVEIVSAYSQNTNLSSRVGRLNPGFVHLSILFLLLLLSLFIYIYISIFKTYPFLDGRAFPQEELKTKVLDPS